jgi:biopolymer transport protein TolQ
VPAPLLSVGFPLVSAANIVELITASKGVALVTTIILLTLVPLAIFVSAYKFVQISQAQSQSITFLDRFWESKRLDDIYKVAEGLRASPLATMFKAGYVELSKIKRANTDPTGAMSEKMDGLENIDRALHRAKVAEMTKLETLLPFLATVGSAAPFIGLFGTVWGVMEAFLNIAAAGQADLATVSQPIAEALITTAVALASAVPAVVMFNYFNRRLKVLNAEMQTFASDYLNIVKRHFF